MARDITNELRRFDPIDPVKYDFSLCQVSMMDQCGFTTSRRLFDHPVIIKELLGALSARFPERLPTVRVFKKRDDGTGHAIGVPNRCQEARFSINHTFGYATSTSCNDCLMRGHCVEYGGAKTFG